MHFILGIIFCSIFIFLFWFIGHIILKKLNVFKEENQLLLNLLRICLGASSFLIVINLFGNLLRDFNLALILSFVITLGIICWQFSDFKQISLNLKDFLKKNNFEHFFKSHTDKYFWILFGTMNFIYGLTAFSTVKSDRFVPGGGHIHNINQLLIGNYPPSYSFLSNIPQRYHYGSDIFGALVSKFSGLHPEISLDILTLFFLNLSLLALYALTIKFLNTNPINKYLVPFTAFLGWGPITLLFKTNPGETLPAKFLDKIQYLTQTRLIDAASWSGLTLNWFFAPPTGFSIFFFLIALYLLFRFFEGEQDLKVIVLLGIFLSSFVILDFSKFIILLSGLLIYVISKSLALFEEKEQKNQAEFKSFLKKVGILTAIFIILGLVHGNFLSFNKAYIPLKEFYQLGKTNMESKFSPFGCNIILIGIFIFGFYKAYKQKIKWVNHLTSFFAVSIIISYLLTIQDAGVGKILVCSSLLGAFALPFAVDCIKTKFDLKEQRLTIFYSSIFIVLSFSTIMFWSFGDRNKSLFTSEGGRLKPAGKQTIPFNDRSSEEFKCAKKLKSKQIKDSSLLSEPQYSEILTINSGLLSPWPVLKFSESNPIKKEIATLSGSKINSLFTLNGKLLQEEKIKLLYLTPKLVRYTFSPQARQSVLNATLNNGGKLLYSNNTEELAALKEAYYIDPKKLSYKPVKNYGKYLKTYLDSTSKNPSGYLKQIAECPYFGIYNAMSNDFDGDKIADLAFFDCDTKIFNIIYGKNNQEEEFDLKNLIFTNLNDSELLTPIPSDYDGDGKTDIALFSENSGRWYIRRSSDSGVDQSKWFGVYIEEIPLPADLDGDFKADTSCFNANHGTWYSGATTNGYYNNNFGLSPLDIPAFADLDGDKKADYIIYKPDKTLVEAYLSSKSFDKQQHIELNIGNKHSRLVPEDYDGDGKVDLAVWTPESGEFEIAYANDFLISSITSGNIPPAFVGCGIPSQVKGENPTPSCATKSFTLGKAGDIPMPGDYNGDGRAEIAIFSRRTGKLEIVFNNGSHKKINLSKYRNLTPASFVGI